MDRDVIAARHIAHRHEEARYQMEGKCRHCGNNHAGDELHGPVCCYPALKEWAEKTIDSKAALDELARQRSEQNERRETKESSGD